MKIYLIIILSFILLLSPFSLSYAEKREAKAPKVLLVLPFQGMTAYGPSFGEYMAYLLSKSDKFTVISPELAKIRLQQLGKELHENRFIDTEAMAWGNLLKADLVLVSYNNGAEAEFRDNKGEGYYINYNGQTISKVYYFKYLLIDVVSRRTIFENFGSEGPGGPGGSDVSDDLEKLLINMEKVVRMINNKDFAGDGDQR